VKPRNSRTIKKYGTERGGGVGEKITEVRGGGEASNWGENIGENL